MLFEKVLQLNPTGRNEGIDLTEEMLSRARARDCIEMCHVWIPHLVLW